MNNWVSPLSFTPAGLQRGIRIVSDEAFGKMLFPDNDLQIAEKDTRFCNESMASPLVKIEIPLDDVTILVEGADRVLLGLRPGTRENGQDPLGKVL